MKAVLLGTACLLIPGCATSGRADRTAAGPVYTGSSEPGVIPAGTNIFVRTNETIETTTTGGAYSAEIARPIVGGAGRVLVPQGSPAQLTVLRADAPGITGGEVTLGLKSIAVAGNTYMVSSATTAEGDRGLGANRRTGIFLGGGATLV